MKYATPLIIGLLLLPVGSSLGQTTGPTSAPAGAGEIEALVRKLSADDIAELPRQSPE